MLGHHDTASPAEVLAGGTAARRPGTIWREALPLLQDRLLADGFSEARAMELGECALIAGALRHVPASVEEACAVAFELLGRSFDETAHPSPALSTDLSPGPRATRAPYATERTSC